MAERGKRPQKRNETDGGNTQARGSEARVMHLRLLCTIASTYGITKAEENNSRAFDLSTRPDY